MATTAAATDPATDPAPNPETPTDPFDHALGNPDLLDALVVRLPSLRDKLSLLAACRSLSSAPVVWSRLGARVRVALGYRDSDMEQPQSSTSQGGDPFDTTDLPSRANLLIAASRLAARAPPPTTVAEQAEDAATLRALLRDAILPEELASRVWYHTFSTADYRRLSRARTRLARSYVTGLAAALGVASSQIAISVEAASVRVTTISLRVAEADVETGRARRKAAEQGGAVPRPLNLTAHLAAVAADGPRFAAMQAALRAYAADVLWEAPSSRVGGHVLALATLAVRLVCGVVPAPAPAAAAGPAELLPPTQVRYDVPPPEPERKPKAKKKKRRRSGGSAR